MTPQPSDAATAHKAGSVAIVLKGYPRLSETFIAQEILGLERAGLDLVLFSMRRPTDKAVHPVNKEIRAPVRYLPEYLHEEPLRVLRSLVRCLRFPGLGRAFRQFAGDYRRDRTRHRLRRFGQALVLAAELPQAVRHLHAHFIHTPASVAQYASLLTGLAWTCSAHAKDIWTSADRDLTEKLESAPWVVTCTRAGYERLSLLAPDKKRVHLSYHGLDLGRFDTPPGRREPVDGHTAGVELLTVCRAVEKKGLDVLLVALARLPEGLQWRWTHVGGGDLVPKLQAQASELGLDGRIRWLGARPQDEVLACYRSSDLFVLPCRVAADGDRDGLPNVLMEAQSQRLCCVSTAVSGVPELIEDGRTGVLVPPDDPAVLADALAWTIADPELRRRLGEEGEQRVRKDFDHRGSVAMIFDLLRPHVGK